MSTSNAHRTFLKELITFLNKRVSVVTIDGKKYSGELKGFHPETLTSVLVKAKREGSSDDFHKIFINGSQIAELFLEEAPFDLKALAEEFERVFRRPGDVKVYDEAGLIVVLERVRVSESGVEGTGPVADRVRAIHERFMEQLRAEVTEVIST